LFSESCSLSLGEVGNMSWALEPDQGAMRRLVGGRGDPFGANRSGQSIDLTLVGAPVSFTFVSRSSLVQRIAPSVFVKIKHYARKAG
jgi:hypothetical protein